MKSDLLKFQILTTLSFALGLALIMNESAILRLMARRFQPVDQVGNVFDVEGQALRRFHKDLLWVPLEKGNPIFNNDVLYSGPKSELKINLSPSSFMRLHSDTLVRVQRHQQQPFVEIEKGQMTLTSQNRDEVLIRENQVTKKILLDSKDKKFSSNSPGKPTELFGSNPDDKGQGPGYNLNASSEIEGSQDRVTENADTSNNQEDSATTLNDPIETPKMNWFDPKVLSFIGLYLFIMLLSILDSYRSKKR